MAITFEQLDNDGKNNDITILVGKNLLLKFIPGDSVFFYEKALQDLIKTSDLLSSKILAKIIEENRLSEGISKKLSDGIEFQETFAGFAGNVKGSPIRSLIEATLKSTKEEVVAASNKIRNIEKETKYYLAKDFPLYFCQECNSYLANSIDSLPENCKVCNKKTDEDKPTFTRFIDAKIISYLNGFWLEDYIAKILKRMDWKTWCHGWVMGSSGISHPVDILAINQKKKRILVAECKSGAFEGKDIFNFAAQYFDIKAPYGLFFALKEKSDSREKDYMKRIPGLCLLDGLGGLTDNQLIEKIEQHLKIL